MCVKIRKSVFIIIVKNRVERTHSQIRNPIWTINSIQAFLVVIWCPVPYYCGTMVSTLLWVFVVHTQHHLALQQLHIPVLSSSCLLYIQINAHCANVHIFIKSTRAGTFFSY